MRLAQFALPVLAALALGAVGCDRSAGVSPLSESPDREDTRGVMDQDLNPRDDPAHFPAVEERGPE